MESCKLRCHNRLDTTNPKTGDDFQMVFWNGMMMTAALSLAVLLLNKKKVFEK